MRAVLILFAVVAGGVALAVAALAALVLVAALATWTVMKFLDLAKSHGAPADRTGGASNHGNAAA